MTSTMDPSAPFYELPLVLACSRFEIRKLRPLSTMIELARFIHILITHGEEAHRRLSVVMLL